MISKLVLRNMKRSLKDYIIYIATITISVGILFAFLSIAFSENISKLAENMANLQNTLIILSILIMFVFSFLINYAMKFIIKRRKKEFGTYMLLGMEAKFIFKMFFAENLILGVSSYIIGLPLGLLIYNLLHAMIMHLFECPFSIELSVSFRALFLSLILFLIIYGFSAVRSSKEVARMKIKDLIYGARYNEMPRLKHPIVRLTLSLVFIIICLGSMYMILSAFKLSDNRAFILIIFGLFGLTLGIYGLHASLPIYIYILKKGTKKWRYKGTNMFLAGQITSKINSTSKIIASSAITLTFALILLMGGLSFGAVYKSNIQYEAPFDITVALDVDIDSFKGVIDFIETKTDIKDYIEYKIYHANEEELKDYPILRLSDYNKLREMIDLDAKIIKDNQFIIHSEEWFVRKAIEERLAEKNDLIINGVQLHSDKELIFTEPFEQSRTNGNLGYILVVPDYICDNLLSNKSRLVLSTIKPADQDLRKQLNQFIREDWQVNINDYSSQGDSQGRITLHIGVKSWSVANSLTGLSILSFGSIYISLILFLITGTILSLQQSSEATENKYRFILLKKLGTRESDMLGIIKKQIGIYFALPSVVPILLTLIIGLIMNSMFGKHILVENLILSYTAIALVIFLVVYSSYMVLSYKLFKWSIFNKKRN